MGSIGIDVGSFSVKVAKVKPSNRGYELVQLSEYPLSQDPSKDNQIEVIEILRDVQNRFYVEGDVYVVGAHQYEVSVRRKEFPFRERHKILKSLPFELEDDIPFSHENSVYDAKITHFVGPTAHLLACACPKEHVVHILQKFSDGGVHPDIVSIDSIALATLFEEWREAPWEYPASEQSITQNSQVDLIINFGHKTTSVLVIKDGYLLDTRLIEWGGKDIAEMISTRYGLHYLEALKDLRKRAFILTNNEGATREQVALSEVVKSSVNGFAQKLRLTLLELKNLHSVEYRQAILVGGVSQLRNLGPYLTQKIEVACNRLSQLDMMRHIDFASSPNNEVAATTAIGLAIEGIKRPKNPAVNLLKGDFAKQSQSAKIFWEKWGHAARILGFAFAATVVWALMRESFSLSNSEVASEQLRSQARNIMGAKGNRVSERNIRSFIREQENKLKVKEMIEKLQGVNSALDILNKISSTVPEKKLTSSNDKNKGGINLFEFKVNADNLVLAGEASQTEVLNNLQQALKGLAQGGALQTRNPPAAKTPGYRSFSYSLKIERSKGVN